MANDGRWKERPGYETNYFLCQGTTVTLTESGLTTIELEKEQLAFLPFHIFFKSKAINHEMLNRSQDKEERMTGFTLNWFLKDSNGTLITEKLPARQEDWTPDVPSPAYKNLLLDKMVNLVRELRLQNITKEGILKEVTHQKSQSFFISGVDQFCLMGQVKEDIANFVFYFNASTTETSGMPSDKDIETGYELYHALVYCPSNLFKMYTFVDQLLSNETSRTIILTIVHLLQSEAIRDTPSYTLAKQFYHVLVSTLDLQYGNILSAISTTAQLQDAIDKKFPFLTNNTDLIKRCVQDQEPNCDFVRGISQNLGKLHYFLLFLLL